MSGDEAPPRSPTPEDAAAPEEDRDASPERGRAAERSRSPAPRGGHSRSRSRSPRRDDPPRADDRDRARSPGARGGGAGGPRKTGIAGRWNSRGFGTSESSCNPPPTLRETSRRTPRRRRHRRPSRPAPFFPLAGLLKATTTGTAPRPAPRRRRTDGRTDLPDLTDLPD